MLKNMLSATGYFVCFPSGFGRVELRPVGCEVTQKYHHMMLWHVRLISSLSLELSRACPFLSLESLCFGRWPP